MRPLEVERLEAGRSEIDRAGAGVVEDVIRRAAVAEVEPCARAEGDLHVDNAPREARGRRDHGLALRGARSERYREGDDEDGGDDEGGDDDEDEAPPKPAARAAPAAPKPTGGLRLMLESGSRKVETQLYVDGKSVRMESVETYASPDAAKKAHDRLKKMLIGEGYKEG